MAILSAILLPGKDGREGERGFSIVLLLALAIDILLGALQLLFSKGSLK